MFEFHKAMIALRRSIPALRIPDKDRTEVGDFEHKPLMYLRRWSDDSEIFALLNLGADPCTAVLPVPIGKWKKLINSADKRWLEQSDLSQRAAAHTINSKGDVEMTLTGFSFALYAREQA